MIGGDVMGKIVKFRTLKIDDPGEYETCVICKGKTDVKKDQPIYRRHGYIEGSGQLCRSCYDDLKQQLP